MIQNTGVISKKLRSDLIGKHGEDRMEWNLAIEGHHI